MLKPWHKIVTLRQDIKDDPALTEFAADLNDVVMGQGPSVYRDPNEFFTFTFPTFNLRELAKDVTMRLAGQNDKAIQQLELIYGGGKTHTLITLYHLTKDPQALAESGVASDFTNYIGRIPPQARIAVLPFDKLDPLKGLEVYGPDGTVRILKQPWSVLAYQLAGSDGLKLLRDDGLEDERELAPAEPLLVELLSQPTKQGLATLVLIDEVMMYVRPRIEKMPNDRGNLLSFFQALTQAATKVKTCAIIVSLLANNLKMNDQFGRELTAEISTIFRRELEQTIEPVVKEDVAEVLRRRFFEPESLKQHDIIGKHVVAIVRNIAAVDTATDKGRKQAEERFAKSYPFHPDLTEVFYSKWTQVPGFQRTRGILRVFAKALHEAEKWDASPIISTNVFLNAPGKNGLSIAANDLATIANTEETEGETQLWGSIIERELERAVEIQQELPVLRTREIEQAIFATFLHSLPAGKKALTRDLFLLIGAAGAQRIDIEKALKRWIEISWFLDESAYQDPETGLIVKGLPGSWRMGRSPNLNQMHQEASSHVPNEIVEEQAEDAIRKCGALTRGVREAGAHHHLLPVSPKDVDDNGEFHFVVLGPSAVSRANHPSQEAKRYILYKTNLDAQRAKRNAVIVVTPSVDGLNALRITIRRRQGWNDVKSLLRGEDPKSSRMQLLESEEKKETQNVTYLARQAYNIVVALSEDETKKDDVIAFKLDASNEPLFAAVRKDPRARIEDDTITAASLLPDGPFYLWHKGDKERSLEDLVGAFAEVPGLPRMLNSDAIIQTMLNGCEQGLFVLRSDYGDGSVKTYWYDEVPSVSEAKKLNLSVVLPQEAEIAEIPFKRLAPETDATFPQLWQGKELRLGDLYRYFEGRTLKMEYNAQFTIPRASRSVVNEGIKKAVQGHYTWFLSGSASFYGDEVADDQFVEEATLQGTPPTVPSKDILPDALPDAWKGEDETTVENIHEALSNKYGKILPWITVSTVIDNALRARFIERVGGAWPCTIDGARFVTIGLRKEKPAPKSGGGRVDEKESPITAKKNGYIKEPEQGYTHAPLQAEAILQDHELQDLMDHMAKIVALCGDLDLPAPTFRVQISFKGAENLTEEQRACLSQALQDVSKKFVVQ